MTVTLSIKIPIEVRKRLEKEARERRTTTSDLMRQALQLILESESSVGSCYELSEDLFRDLGAGPRDLSTNDKYLEDFGR